MQTNTIDMIILILSVVPLLVLSIATSRVVTRERSAPMSAEMRATRFVSKAPLERERAHGGAEGGAEGGAVSEAEGGAKSGTASGTEGGGTSDAACLGPLSVFVLCLSSAHCRRRAYSASLVLRALLAAFTTERWATSSSAIERSGMAGTVGASLLDFCPPATLQFALHQHTVLFLIINVAVLASGPVGASRYDEQTAAERMRSERIRGLQRLDVYAE